MQGKGRGEPHPPRPFKIHPTPPTSAYMFVFTQGGSIQCRGRGRGNPLPEGRRKGGVGAVQHLKPPSHRGWWDSTNI